MELINFNVTKEEKEQIERMKKPGEYRTDAIKRKIFKGIVFSPMVEDFLKQESLPGAISFEDAAEDAMLRYMAIREAELIEGEVPHSPAPGTMRMVGERPEMRFRRYLKDEVKKIRDRKKHTPILTEEDIPRLEERLAELREELDKANSFLHPWRNAGNQEKDSE